VSQWRHLRGRDPGGASSCWIVNAMDLSRKNQVRAGTVSMSRSLKNPALKRKASPLDDFCNQDVASSRQNSVSSGV
jgi:hypothetical protein